jgi:hypothetical protein
MQAAHTEPAARRVAPGGQACQMGLTCPEVKHSLSPGPPRHKTKLDLLRIRGILGGVTTDFLRPRLSQAARKTRRPGCTARDNHVAGKQRGMDRTWPLAL